MQISEQPLEVDWLCGLAPWSLPLLEPRRRASSKPLWRVLFYRKIFDVPVLGNQLEDVQPGGLSEFGTEEHIVANVINARDQLFQDKRRLIARQGKLTDLIG